MKIGLLGGSFNPPHKGHIHISKLALQKLNLSQIWWLPCAYNQFKDRKIYESYEQRLAKCVEIVKNEKKIKVKNYSEVNTVKLLYDLKKRYKNIEFYWIMGADNMPKLHRWHQFKKLIILAKFVVFSRETFLLKMRQTPAFSLISKQKEGFLKIIRSKKLDISSTEIRASKKSAAILSAD